MGNIVHCHQTHPIFRPLTPDIRHAGCSNLFRLFFSHYTKKQQLPRKAVAKNSMNYSENRRFLKLLIIVMHWSHQMLMKYWEDELICRQLYWQMTTVVVYIYVLAHPWLTLCGWDKMAVTLQIIFFQTHFPEWKYRNFNSFLLNLILKSPVNNNPALAQIMAWRRIGDKPLSEPTMA